MNFYSEGGAGWSPRSTCWLQLNLQQWNITILYFIDFIFYLDDSFKKFHETFNGTPAYRCCNCSNLILDLCLFSKVFRIAISLELHLTRMFLTDKSEKISNDFAILTLLYLYLKDNQAMCEVSEVSEVQHKLSLWWNFNEWQELCCSRLESAEILCLTC